MLAGTRGAGAGERTGPMTKGLVSKGWCLVPGARELLNVRRLHLFGRTRKVVRLETGG